MNLKDYNSRVVVPTIISGIQRGMFDDVIDDPDLDDIYKSSPEILNEVKRRRELLCK